MNLADSFYTFLTLISMILAFNMKGTTESFVIPREILIFKIGWTYKDAELWCAIAGPIVVTATAWIAGRMKVNDVTMIVSGFVTMSVGLLFVSSFASGYSPPSIFIGFAIFALGTSLTKVTLIPEMIKAI